MIRALGTLVGRSLIRAALPLRRWITRSLAGRFPHLCIVLGLVAALASGVAAAVAAQHGRTYIKTCVHRGPMKLGCVYRVYQSRDGSPSWDTFIDCGGTVWGNSRWLWLDESASHVGAAKRLGPGRWRVLDWSFGTPTQGYVIRRAPKVWSIRDSKGRPRAAARGRDGPAAGLILLGFGAHCLLP